jgi:hypothetical protein
MAIPKRRHAPRRKVRLTGTPAINELGAISEEPAVQPMNSPGGLASVTPVDTGDASVVHLDCFTGWHQLVWLGDERGEAIPRRALDSIPRPTITPAKTRSRVQGHA